MKVMRRSSLAIPQPVGSWTSPARARATDAYETEPGAPDLPVCRAILKPAAIRGLSIAPQKDLRHPLEVLRRVEGDLHPAGISLAGADAHRRTEGALQLALQAAQVRPVAGRAVRLRLPLRRSRGP